MDKGAIIGRCEKEAFCVLLIFYSDLIVCDTGMFVLWQINNVHNYDCWTLLSLDPRVIFSRIIRQLISVT